MGDNRTSLNRRVGSLNATLKIEESNFNSGSKDMVNRYHDRGESMVIGVDNMYIKHEVNQVGHDLDMDNMLQIIQKCQTPGSPQ